MSRLIELENAVDTFALKMKKKLRAKSHEGKQGWNDPYWSVQDIKKQLREHITKGDPVDVANFALFWYWKLLVKESKE